MNLLEECRRVVSEKLQKDSSGPALEAILTSHFTSKVVLELLTSLIAEQDTEAEMYAEAYAHSNGFVKIVLIQCADPQFKLRLHVWPTAMAGQEDSDIHNHRWDFASRVLIGSFANKVFAEEESRGVLMRQYKYSPRAGRDAFLLSYLCNRPIWEVESRRLDKGIVYWMSSWELHRLQTINSGVHASLVLQGPTLRSSTTVYSERTMEEGEFEVSSPPLDKSKVFSLFRLVQSLLP